MLKYIIRDIYAVLRFLPYGIVAGVVVLIFLEIRNHYRFRRGKEPLPIPAAVSFYTYLAIMLAITYFSRESGNGKIDMKLFSTLGINNRNNAYVVENILLFIPYGIVCPWYFEKLRGFFKNALAGFLTTVVIECLQLVTGRGVFQIDDILTNLLGSIIGWFLFRLVFDTRRGKTPGEGDQTV